MAAVRTNTGCWTCRIRKKKCDDIQPVCGPCTLRRITCHGYGPRPRFMDSAEDQKTEIEKIKGAVSQSVKARRAFRVSKEAHRATQSPAEVQASQAARTQTPTQVPDNVYSDLLEQPQLSSSAP